MACPELALSVDTFTAAATAAVTALGATLTSTSPAQTFDPYSSADLFYLGAFIFEDVGVTAYKGAIQNLQVRLYGGVQHLLILQLIVHSNICVIDVHFLNAELHLCSCSSWYYGH